MPTNQQRRDAAKRKLERQLVRRQEQQKSRRQRTIIAGVIAAVVVIAGVVFIVTKKPAATDSAAGDDTAASSTAPASACTYTDAETTVKAVNKPDNTNPLTTGTVDATITLGQGALPVTLDRSLAPCAVNAFLSLAAQKFYDGTSCHRLTTDANFKILQCGDPSGTGRGGPGFAYSAETSPAADPTDPAATTPPAEYPVGTLAMASTTAGGENGSQFFVVYGDTSLDTGYTKIGTVSAAGLAVVDQIAAKGTKVGANPNGASDAPAEPVDITSVTVPDDALTPTQPPATTDSATDGVPTDVLPTDGGTTDTGATDGGADPGTDGGSTDPGATDGVTDGGADPGTDGGADAPTTDASTVESSSAAPTS